MYPSLQTHSSGVFGDFERLRRELDTARIEANLKNGVLNLRIPKQQHAQPRRIQVQVN